ncbi:MAG: transposase zinc-binding domain-containing protein [Myxococcota bacterium]|nr:transposase zinc-binding domain-containing protein [Myxococcota bacterium]
MALTARARCAACKHDFVVPFSCKTRGLCPSCNTRRMVETAAHLVDHVIPRVPVRLWGVRHLHISFFDQLFKGESEI